MWIVVGNLVLPGSGLLLRDRLLAGLALLLPALLLLALALLAPLVATPDFAPRLLLAAVGGHLLLAASAGALWWLWERERPVDRALVLRRHREAAQAYLSGDLARARSEALALCRHAPGLPGCWQLLAEIETAAGDQAAAEAATQRGTRLRQRLRERGATVAAA